MNVMRQVDFAHLLAALSSLAGVTAGYVGWLHVTNASTVAVSYLLIVLLVAASSQLWVAIVTSIAAMLTFNFYFFPPVGTLTIADPAELDCAVRVSGGQPGREPAVGAGQGSATRRVESARRSRPSVRSQPGHPAHDRAGHRGDRDPRPPSLEPVSARLRVDLPARRAPSSSDMRPACSTCGMLLTTEALRSRLERARTVRSSGTRASRRQARHQLVWVDARRISSA